MSPSVALSGEKLDERELLQMHAAIYIYMQGCAMHANDAGAHVPWTALFKIAPKHVPPFSL